MSKPLATKDSKPLSENVQIVNMLCKDIYMHAVAHKVFWVVARVLLL